MYIYAIDNNVYAKIINLNRGISLSVVFLLINPLKILIEIQEKYGLQ